MKTCGVNAVSFGKLYISGEGYNEYQQKAVADIKEKMTPEYVKKLEKRGYDVFVNGDTYYNYEVYVYAQKKLSSDGLRIGCYSSNFDANDVERAIDKKEAKDSKHRAIGWTIIATLGAALLAAITLKDCSKIAANTDVSAIQKAKTELVNKIA